MNAQEIIYLIGDSILLTAIPALALFIFYYATKSPWKTLLVGRSLMYFAVSLLSIVVVVAMSVWLGTDYYLREWVRLLTYALMSITTWRLFVTLRYIQRMGPGTDGIGLLNPQKKSIHLNEEILMNVRSKYLTPILTIAIIAGAAFQTAIVGGISTVEAFQLLGLLVGAFVTYMVPVLEAKWAAAAKVGGAVLGAVLAAIVPVVDLTNGGTGFNAETITMIAFAGLSALAAQFGVDQRLDSAKAALATTEVENAAVVAVDPAAVKVVARDVAESESVAVDTHDGRTGL